MSPPVLAMNTWATFSPTPGMVLQQLDLVGPRQAGGCDRPRVVGLVLPPTKAAAGPFTVVVADAPRGPAVEGVQRRSVMIAVSEPVTRHSKGPVTLQSVYS